MIRHGHPLRVTCAALAATLAVAVPHAGRAQSGAQTPASAAAPTVDTSTATAAAFRRYADRVVKVQILESGAEAKSSLGSGFFVSDRGHVITNYHVIADIVNHPENYKGELIDRAGAKAPVTVLAVDVVNDLAILSSGMTPAARFDLRARPASRQGDRLLALGHPRDLGLSIVEGTYNGLLQHSLYPKLHFTGSLNPGMSGGPAITPGGEVVGVNVSTAGNQLSFLVPVERAAALLDRVTAQGFVPSRALLADVAAQLRDNQARYAAGMFAAGSKTVTLGSFVLPTEPAPFFRCWGGADRRRTATFSRVYHGCSTDDEVFVSGDQSSGVVELSHEYLHSDKLSPLQFYSLLQQRFAGDADGSDFSGTEEDFTRFHCTTDNVRNGAATMRTALCVRRYKRLPGLYDAVLKVVVLGARNAGVLSTLTMTGVSYTNVSALTKGYLERIAWKG